MVKVQESEWAENFRMLRKSFDELNAKLYPLVERQRTTMKNLY